MQGSYRIGPLSFSPLIIFLLAAGLFPLVYILLPPLRQRARAAGMIAGVLTFFAFSVWAAQQVNFVTGRGPWPAAIFPFVSAFALMGWLPIAGGYCAGWLVERRLSEGTADSRGFTLLLLVVLAAAVLLPSIYGIRRVLREDPPPPVMQAPQVSTPPVPQVVLSEPSAAVFRGLALPSGGGFLDRGWRSLNLGGTCQLQRWVSADSASLLVSFHWQPGADERGSRRDAKLLVGTFPAGFAPETRIAIESPRLTLPAQASVHGAAAVLEDDDAVEVLKNELAQGESWTIRIVTANGETRTHRVTADGFDVAGAMFDACVTTASKVAN